MIKYMKSQQYIQNCASGFTLMELLVAITLSMIVIGLLLSTTITSKNLFRADVARTKINQDLRAVMDIIGSQARVTGENLSADFPAILVENNANGTSDSLILRRNLLDEVLKVCTPVVAGSLNDIYITGADDQAGCIFADNTHNYQVWSAYRAEQGGEVSAYIFNTSSKLGEFFIYDGESDTSTILAPEGDYLISRYGDMWQNDYDELASAIYMLEEWKIELVNDTLQLTINEEDTPQNIAFGITEFQVQIILQDNTVLNDFDSTDDWTNMKAIRVTLTGSDSYAGKTLTRTLSTEFFPRNILSN
jgi:hypothetical protein